MQKKKPITSMLRFISAYFKMLFLISVLISFTYHISLYIFSVGLSYYFQILKNKCTVHVPFISVKFSKDIDI